VPLEPRDARDVRPGEQLDWPRLVAWLRDRLPACGVPGLDVSREPEIAQFPGGHSNLTYLVRFGDVDIVVRRPPFGPLPPTAHDMAREFRWLSAMHRVFPLAPQATCSAKTSRSSGRCSMRWSAGAAWWCAPTNRRRSPNPPRDDASATR
jgi:aminoglycoside phosphotransferase (APT) family kinase protein